MNLFYLWVRVKASGPPSKPSDMLKSRKKRCRALSSEMPADLGHVDLYPLTPAPLSTDVKSHNLHHNTLIAESRMNFRDLSHCSLEFWT